MSDKIKGLLDARGIKSKERKYFEFPNTVKFDGQGNSLDLDIKTGDEGILLSSGRIYAELEFTKLDGTDFKGGTEAHLTTNYFAYLFREARVSIYNSEIFDVKNLGYTSTLFLRVNHNDEADEIAKLSGFDASDLKDVYEKTVYVRMLLKDLIPGIETINVPLFNADIRISITRNTDNESIWASTKDFMGKISIKSMKLHIPLLAYNEVEKVALFKEIADNKYLIKCDDFRCRNYTNVWGDSFSVDITNQTQSLAKPWMVFLFFIKANKINNQLEVTSDWYHNYVRNVWAMVGDSRRPDCMQNCNFEKGDVLQFYSDTLHYASAKKGSSNQMSPFHSLKNFKDFNTFYCIDLRFIDRSITGGKQNITVNFDFSKSIPANDVVLYVVTVTQRIYNYDMVNRKLLEIIN